MVGCYVCCWFQQYDSSPHGVGAGGSPGGTVTDSTGAVLPGVTITAVNTATGNTFVDVTDERGVYRQRSRRRTRLRAELPGFRAVTRRIAAARRRDRHRQFADAGGDGR